MSPVSFSPITDSSENILHQRHRLLFSRLIQPILTDGARSKRCVISSLSVPAHQAATERETPRNTWKNDYWHTDKDTLDKLSAESLETVGRVLVRVLNKLTH